MLRGAGQNKPGAEGQGGIGGLLAQLGLGGASAGGVLGGGLDELVKRFKQKRNRAGPNEPCTADQLEQAIGPDVFAKLITPGDNEPSGFILTTILGIVGAFVSIF
jgi:hypothetical protein